MAEIFIRYAFKSVFLTLTTIFFFQQEYQTVLIKVNNFITGTVYHLLVKKPEQEKVSKL